MNAEQACSLPCPSFSSPPAPALRLCEDTTLLYGQGQRQRACRLRLFLPQLRPLSQANPAVAIVSEQVVSEQVVSDHIVTEQIGTEQTENEGLSSASGIETIAREIVRCYRLNPRHTILIEHCDERDKGFVAHLPERIRGGKFSCIVFEEMQAIDGAIEGLTGAILLRRPQWRSIDKNEVEALIGAPLP